MYTDNLKRNLTMILTQEQLAKVREYSKIVSKQNVIVNGETKMLVNYISYNTIIGYESDILEYFDYLVLAVGHSATKVYELLKEKEVELEPKNFAVGVRIEHLQSKINEVQYHGVYQNLGAADYKLVAHVNGRSL